MDTVDRIFARMKELKLEQKELAFQIGVTPQQVSKWNLRQSRSYTKYIPQLAKALLTSSEWLLTGERDVSESDTIQQISEKDAKLLLAYQQADPALKELIKKALGL